MSRFFYIYFIIAFLFTFFITLFFPKESESTSATILKEKILFQLSNKFKWPVPGYSTITSNFGYRNAPTAGASTYHSGIDIAASPGSNIVATFSGTVTYTGFYGANGFTVMVSNDSYTAVYSHVSPNFIVNLNDTVIQGQIIANVGPKNVYNVPGNNYKDSNGIPTNGATTGPHLHFTIKKDGQAVNPLEYL